jgi:malic enzyme
MLPDIDELRDVNFEIAVNVAKQALADGVTSLDPKTDIEALVRSCQWAPNL